MIHWRIYYADGSTFSDAEGDYWRAPAVGVVGIVQVDTDTGRSFWKDCDYYWFENEYDLWLGGDLAGLLDYLNRTRLATVLQGRTVPDRVYRRIREAMVEDADFPRRSAWHRRERDGQAV